MNFTITRVFHLNQNELWIDVVDDSGILHTLSFDTIDFYDLTLPEKLEEIQIALKDKLASELNMQEIVGEQITLNTIYRKSLA